MLKNVVGSLFALRGKPAAAVPSGVAAATASSDAGVGAEAGRLRGEGRYGAALRVLRSLDLDSVAEADRRLEEARVLSQWGRHREAAAAGCTAVESGLRDARAVGEVSSMCLRAGDAPRALALADEARARSPDDRTLDRHRAAALQANGRLDEALQLYGALIEADPQDVDALLAMADCHAHRGELVSARACLLRAVDSAPDAAPAWAQLAAIDAVEGRFDEAFRAFARARDASRDGAAGGAFANHAVALFRCGRWDECRALLEDSLPRRPDLNGHMQLGPTLLAHGEFGEGWRQYEFRWLNGQFATDRPAWVRPHWDGQDLRGKTIVVVPEQGIGDFLQFSRYLPMLRERGARVVLQPSDATKALAARLPGIDVLLDEGDAFPPHDYFAFLLSLPRAFGTRLDTIPPCAPALAPRPEFAAKWNSRLGPHDRPRVGVVWAGRPEHARDRQRSIALPLLVPLLDVPGVRFIGLQKGPAVVQAEGVPERVEWINLGPELDDLDDAAAVIAELDLVVTVDTALAHLGGIMGKPVWMLVADPPDFRWLVDGEDTPWYPTLRLFRQAAPGDWSAPVARLADDVRRWAVSYASSASSSQPLPAPGPAPERRSRAVPTETHVPHLTRALPTRCGFLQYDPDEPLVGRSIEHYGEWLNDRCALAVALAPAGGVVVEAGPGVGAHAIPLAQKLGPAGHLLLLEPRPAIRQVLAQNLAANRIANATLLERGLAGPDAASADADTVDDLSLDRVDGLKVNEGADAAAIVEGAQETLWRCRPWLVLAVDGDAALDGLAARVREFGYRAFRMETACFAPSNFNRREDDVFGGRRAHALVALPEEVDLREPLPGCVELR